MNIFFLNVYTFGYRYSYLALLIAVLVVHLLLLYTTVFHNSMESGELLRENMFQHKINALID